MSLPTKGIGGSGLAMSTKGILSSLFVGAVWQPIMWLTVTITRIINHDVER
jgi:hypothetical protein